MASDRIKWMNSGLHNAVLENDERKFSEILDPDSVKHFNLKFETPLHLAAKKTDVRIGIITDLIKTGSDINAKNRWGQTPLHYAAISKSVTNMKLLLRAPGVNVQHKDVNGYNALHTFLYQDYESRYSLHETCETRNVLEGMKLLLDAGIDINDQTKFGYNILHLASRRSDNHSVLLDILKTFTTVNIAQLNEFGENFLHIYARSDTSDCIISLLEALACQTSSVQGLLNQKNANGETPWSIMINDSNMSEEDFDSIVRLGMSATLQNNFGDTVLHTKLNNPFFEFILQHVLAKDKNINIRNIFGQSCIFLLYMEPILNMLIHSNVDFHTTDRWGRTPFMSIMALRPRPVILQKMIQHCKADVNSTDCYGTTPLHLATYFNFEEQVELLMRHGADVNSVDKIGDKPIDTIKRHCSFRCYAVFKREKTFELDTLYARNKSIDEILLEIPKSILSSSIESKDPEDIREILGLPQNMREFSTRILKEKYLRNPVHTSEVDNITSSINALVQTVCKKISDYDERFLMEMYPTGSSAEGTKVGPPDEFDFVLCLTKLEELCEIQVPHTCSDKGYACLLFKDSPHTEENYLPFSDWNGYFLAFPYLQYLARYIQRALSEPNLWQSGNFYYNKEKPLFVISGKPVFNFEVYWIGPLFKHLKISIDLVPAVYKKGWWPKNINIKDIPLVNEHIASAGCFLMLQTFSNTFHTQYKWETIDDAIVDTCNPEYSEDYWDHRMLRVSSAPAEIRLMQSLPEQFRHAYALAKILVSEIVCPDIEIDKISADRYAFQTKFQLEKPGFFKPGRLIKSYMLKNCVFYTMQELRETNDVFYITTVLFNRLLKCSEDYNFVPYFLPLSDVFQFEKEEQRSSYKDYILKLKRQLSIKLVLGMLTHQQD